MEKALPDVTEPNRSQGRVDEENFWKSFVCTERFQNNWCTSSPNPELNSEIDLFLTTVSSLSKGNVSVLDIGSGPVSILSRSTSSANCELHAVDPLADFYKKILPNNIDQFDVVIPNTMDAEELSTNFGANSFDVVHIRNALDHTKNPITSLREMFSIAKENGFVVIHGFENEATWENWVGMHQWNLSLCDNDLLIENNNGEIVKSSDILPANCNTVYSRSTKLESEKTWMTFILQKQKVF